MKNNIIKTYKLFKHLHFQRAPSDVVTPIELALEMIDRIPQRLFNTEVLIPGSGYGTFAMALIHRGWDPAKITCVELDAAFALVCSKYVGCYGVTTIHTDFLSWQTDMQFDVVIGNPPYQNGKNSNFYVKFIERSAELLKEGGYFSYLIPNRFTLPHTPAAKSLRSNFQLGKLTANVSSWFPNVGTTIGWVTGSKAEGGHVGTTTMALLDDTEIEYDPARLTVPSKRPDAEGVAAWHEIAKLDSYVVTRRKPESGSFVFVRRQWRSKGGRIYLDAMVGESPDKWTDGGYIVTDDPEAVVEHLRGDVGPTIHKLFGDQMNVWPCLWQHIPTREAWQEHCAS